MTDHSFFKLTQPGTFSDPLTEVLRSGARTLLTQAVEAEVAAFLDTHADERTEDSRRRVVRHGHLPAREIMTGIGPVAVRTPRVRDRVYDSRLPDQGPQRAVGLLRLPRRALEALADVDPIERTFATVRHRTVRSKGCLSNRMALAMIFKLAQAAEKSWRRSMDTTSCRK